MKKLLFFVAAAVAVAGSLSAAWTYDATEGTISDGVWKFGATVKSGTTELTVNAVQVAPSEVSPLDFSQPVTDSDGASYTIVKLNPQFGSAKCVADNNNPHVDLTVRDEAAFVGSLLLPSAGLVSIGNGAFTGCANLSGTIVLPDGLETIDAAAFAGCTGLSDIENYIPDSVTTLGAAAFYAVPVARGVRVASVSTLGTSVFFNSGITSIYLGPAFKKFSASHWSLSPLRGCAALTSFTFDAAVSGAEWTAQNVFTGCGAISMETLDLSGFKTINADWGLFSCKTLTKIILGDGLSTLNGKSFKPFSALAEVTFAGKPPKSLTNLYADLGSKQEIKTYVQLDYIEDWKPLAKDGAINDYSSTFSTDYFSAALLPYRLLLCKEAGGGGGDLGDAVVKDGILTMPNGWKFETILKGANLFVETCVGVPDAPSPLDFSVRTTDDTGHDLVVYALESMFATAVAYGSGGSDGNQPYVTLTPALVDGRPACEKLTAVTFPTNGVYEIGAGAFAGCTALTEVSLPTNLVVLNTGAFASCTNLRKIENYIPDSVTTLGAGAFYQVPANGEVRLYSIEVTPDLAFWKSGVESVYFGPKLKNLRSEHWSRGPFLSCAVLTNITFDAGITGASWAANSIFSGTNIQNDRFDLSGFSTVYCDWGALSAPKCGEVVFGEKLSFVHPKTCSSLSSLTNIVFKGPVPRTATINYQVRNWKPWLDSVSKTRRIATRISRKMIDAPNADGDCWRNYAQDGHVAHRGTTFTADAVGFKGADDLSNRPLLTIEPDGLMMIIK